LDVRLWHPLGGATTIDISRCTTHIAGKIVALEKRNLDDASRMLAAAFFHYPMFIHYFPEPSSRSRLLQWYLRNVLRCVIRYGEALTTLEMAGALFALHPGHTSLSLWEYAMNGFLFTPLVLGLRRYRRSMECEDFVGRIHKEVMGGLPHYYLWGVAVDPEHQSKGIGSALMYAYLERVDREQMSVYLETHEERNVSYYERYGFELVLETSIPNHDLPIWCMERAATIP